MQAAMAQFRPQLLADQINQQFSRLGGLASLGQNAAAGVGNAGMQTGGAVSGLLAQQGAAQAGGRLAQGAAWGNAIGSIGQAAGMYGAMGGFKSPSYTTSQIVAANATNVPYGYQPSQLRL
jgi:hypothetical protein